jgi:hypothetical protein
MIKTPNNKTFTNMFLKNPGFPPAGSIVLSNLKKNELKIKTKIKNRFLVCVCREREGDLKY